MRAAPTSTCTARCASHCSSPPTARRAPPACACSPRRLGRARLVGRRPLRGRGRHRRHAVPRRLGDDGARRGSSATSTWSSTRSSTSSATSPARCESVAPVDDELARAAPAGAVRESWMHVEIDRIRDGDDAARDRRATCSGCCATSARRSRTGRRCTPRSLAIVDELDDRPAAAADAEEIAQGRGAAELAGRRPLHLPRLPRVPPRARGRRRAAPRRARHRPRHPARRPGHVARRSASCRRRGQAPRPARRRCWCWPRPTPARPCTARRTSTTSA